LKLTEHFSLSEFLKTSHSHAGTPVTLTPSEKEVSNLTSLAELMETIRAVVSRPIIITSGFRNPLLNKKVGGAKGSLHLRGLACDFVVKTPKWEFFEHVSIIYNEPDCDFGKLICYPSEKRFHIEMGDKCRVLIKDKHYIDITGVLRGVSCFEVLERPWDGEPIRSFRT